MTARLDALMTAIAEGGTVDFAPHSRMEEYLMRCLEGGGTEGLPTPISRVDVQLYEIIENGGMGTGGTYVPDEDVATDEAVEETLEEIFGEDTTEDSGTTVPDEAVATDDEVSAMIDEVFDDTVVN